MTKEDRRNHIIRLINQSDGKQILTTRELSEFFGISEMTVRRDLEDLSREGLLQRQHGGAAPTRQAVEQLRKEIGVLLISQSTKFSDPFFNAVLEGVDTRLKDLGYRIGYIHTQAEINSVAEAQTLLQLKTEGSLILVGPQLGKNILDYLKANIRTLVSTIGSIGSEYDRISFDGYHGMYSMVDHLVQRGYRRLGFMTGNTDSRYRAFHDGVAAHGLDADPALCIVVPQKLDGWTPQMGRTGAEQLMRLAAPPDAIVCASDLLAIGAIQWLHQHKYRVPEDIAVTGFDDIAESAFTVPSLTTVHVHKQLIGSLAAERVVKRIENEGEVPLSIRTPTHLVIRHSCGS